jgi:hypothetical protein
MRYIIENLYLFFNLFGYLELILTNGTSGCGPSNSTGDDLCTNLYHGYATFCKQGECGCMSNSSYYANGTCGMLKIFE